MLGAPFRVASPGHATVLRFCIGAVPAILVVIFAGIVGVLALLLDQSRRGYALEYADRCVELAAVLVGSSRPLLNRVTASAVTSEPAQTLGPHQS